MNGFGDKEATERAAARDAATLARQASEAGKQAMAQAGEVIQGAAREAGNLYQQGSRAGDYITSYAAEQPVTAMLIAGAIGYALAFLIHRR